jgi:hypothetical protein
MSLFGFFRLVVRQFGDNAQGYAQSQGEPAVLHPEAGARGGGMTEGVVGKGGRRKGARQHRSGEGENKQTHQQAGDQFFHNNISFFFFLRKNIQKDIIYDKK